MIAPSVDSDSGVAGAQEGWQAISAWISILCLWVAMGHAATQKQNLFYSLVNYVPKREKNVILKCESRVVFFFILLAQILCTLSFVKIRMLSRNNQARVTRRINTGQGHAFGKWLAESKHGNFSIADCRNQQQWIKCTSFPVRVWWKCLHNNWKPWMFVGTLSLNALSAVPRNSANSSFEQFFKFPFHFFVCCSGVNFVRLLCWTQTSDN